MVLMILGLILVLLMIYSGYQAGLVHVLARLILFVLIFFVATQLSKPLGQVGVHFLTGHFIRPQVPDNVSQDGSQFLASGLAFSLIMFLGSMLSRYLLRSVHFVRRIPILGRLDGLLGGLFYGAVGLVICFFILQVLSVIPNFWIQNQLVNSPVLNYFLDRFPVFSQNIYQWWL
ncbi:CvpA family protein [Eupransor demetentiae]|uniref:Regulator of purF expression and biofilm formation (CvpA) n=1 Tax=Eupransor demetentiae TaxID=3109584 RepID=A0ABP0ETZ3_9LACO|nr:Colicin V production accessory protein CvpA [Lactobacillaceae bacterium LMG 33000]